MGRVPRPLPLLDPLPDTGMCCAPLAAAPLSAGEAEQLARRLKALADPARLRLVSLLLAADRGEMCTCELTEPLGLAQPTVTHHLATLTRAGLVAGERRGTMTYYRAVPAALDALAGVLTGR